MLQILLAATAAAGFLASPAALADKDKDESGKGRRSEYKQEFRDGNCKVERKWERGGEYKEEVKCEGRGGDRHARSGKEEFRDGNCKVERKWEKDGGYKEERTCKGPARAVAAPAAVYPPWIVQQQGEYVYKPQYKPAPVAGTFRCNSDNVGRVLGGIIGGVLGNQIGQGDGRTLATVGGAVAGVLVGGEIGRRMDSRDHACVGEVLEVAPVGRRVEWVQGPTNYVVVPGAVQYTQGSYCRPYRLEMRTQRGLERTNGTACRRPDGVWIAH